MAKKKLEKKIKRKKVKFSLQAPQASEVLLLGDFNEWNGKKHQMKKGKNGEWEKALVLMPGTYEYKYKIDGNWQEDPFDDQHRLNPFGTYNSLITVDR